MNRRDQSENINFWWLRNAWAQAVDRTFKETRYLRND